MNLPRPAAARCLLPRRRRHRARSPPARPDPARRRTPPIVFVHGNGDTAALWTTTIWRFESNGWPRDRLLAIDLPYPLARDDDAKPQPGRTSTAEHMRVPRRRGRQRCCAATGASKVVLVGSSRGGNAIRNYIATAAARRTVSHAVLGGVPNHGVWAIAGFLPGSEFNGAGPFLTRAQRAAGPDGNEVAPGVALADDPLRQQRQVRAARRRLDRRRAARRPT